MALFNTSWPAVPMANGRFQFDNGGPQLNALKISVGTFTATGSAVTVANTAVTATSAIVFTLGTAGGTVSAAPYVTTITPGTGFTVDTGASDTSVYNYAIIG